MPGMIAMIATDNNLTSLGPGEALAISNRAFAMLLQLSFARAAELARAGHFAEAESLLSERTHEEFTPAVLDLLARIRAQQGRTLEARDLWIKAAKIDNAHGAYQEGVRRLAATRPAWLRPALLFMGLLAIVLCFVVGAAMLGRYTLALRTSSKPETRHEGTKAATEEVRLPKESVEQMPNIELTVPGTSLKTEARQTEVTFNSGLFARGASLKRDASAMLATLAQQLKPYAGKITVQVIGCTDDVPVPKSSTYKDNPSLGLRRAANVIERLRSGGLPAEMLFAGSGGESFAPYPNNSRENRARNQTVVLRISNNSR